MGLFQVCGKIRDVAYRLILPEDWKIRNAFHVSLLRPFVGDVPEDMVPEEQPEVEELDEILFPEQILAHKDRKVRGKVARRYLVKFKNYSPMDAKWMEEADLVYFGSCILSACPIYILILATNQKQNLCLALMQSKWPLLHMLASSGQYFFLDQFLNLGVEVDEEDEDGYTPLQRAVQARRETAVSQLLRAGAKTDVLDRDGANLLHSSALVHSLHLVKLFVIQGVQVNHADKYGWTPLHVAVLTGRDDVVRHLLLSGAKQSMRNEDGMTPMDIAVSLGKGLNSIGVARTLRRLHDVELMA
ncbi:hypothetical protein L7F22_035810 [Adiantum nelumboides]|nr:hypothetical protein [Adiantum nelumboides]